VSFTTVVVGRGRAGGSFAGALRGVGWEVSLVPHTEAGGLGHSEAELVLLCVPDSAVAEVSRQIPPSPRRVVAHCAGALGLAPLAPHPRRGSVHPLVALTDPERGAEALLGAWFAVAGDPSVADVVVALGGSQVEVGDEHRVAYHAAAVVASNHLVALMGQVQRLAEPIGVPLDAYLQLARGALDGVAEVGPHAALTGPVARGDWHTVLAHLATIPESERPAYRAMAAAAARLVGAALPPELAD
jgi:predicted short-subunit dehydrogenase-like oxidoreductase (DUF2520 family)